MPEKGDFKPLSSDFCAFWFSSLVQITGLTLGFPCGRARCVISGLIRELTGGLSRAITVTVELILDVIMGATGGSDPPPD